MRRGALLGLTAVAIIRTLCGGVSRLQQLTD